MPKDHDGLDANHLDFVIKKRENISSPLGEVRILSNEGDILGQGTGLLRWQWEQQEIRSRLTDIEIKSMKNSEANSREAIEIARTLLDSNAGYFGIHLQSSVDWRRMLLSAIEDRDWKFTRDSRRIKVSALSGNLEIDGLLGGGYKDENEGCFLPLSTFTISSNPSSHKKYRLVKLRKFHSLFSLKQLRDADRTKQTRFKIPSTLVEIPVRDCIFELQEHYEGGLYLFSEIGKYSIAEHERLEAAVITAIGFVASQLVTSTIEHQVDDKAVTKFNVSIEGEDHRFSPFYHYWKDDAPYFPLIGKIAELIVRDGSNQLRSIIRHYLTSPGPLFASVRALHICTLLDALFQDLPRILEWPEQDRSSYVADLGKAREALESCDLSEANRARILGAFGSLEDKSLREKYYYAHSSLNLNVLDKEWKTFNKWRSKLAHGKFEDPYDMDEDKYQDSIDAMLIFVNVFNKIILAASGYRDMYYDFTFFGYRDLQ